MNDLFGKLHFILLLGETGSGKGVFANHYYRGLVTKYSADKLKFLFLDMTGVDYKLLDSPYLYKKTITSPELAIKELEGIANNDFSGHKLIVHIEEADMVYHDKDRLESALFNIINKDNITVIFSTSRLDPEYLDKWLQYAGLRIIFKLSNEADSKYLAGSDIACKLEPGRKILIAKNVSIVLPPLSKKKAEKNRELTL